MIDKNDVFRTAKLSKLNISEHMAEQIASDANKIIELAKTNCYDKNVISAKNIVDFNDLRCDTAKFDEGIAPSDICEYNEDGFYRVGGSVIDGI